MFKRDDIQRLYWLLDCYLSGKVDEVNFCDEYYYCYDLGIDYDKLSENEQQAFSELSTVSSRFSQFEEDHKLDPNAFATKEELHKKIIETHEKLRGAGKL